MSLLVLCAGLRLRQPLAALRAHPHRYDGTPFERLESDAGGYGLDILSADQMRDMIATVLAGGTEASWRKLISPVEGYRFGSNCRMSQSGLAEQRTPIERQRGGEADHRLGDPPARIASGPPLIPIRL